ncbi:MAG: AraC family transcriptional regulator [Bacteroidetes bacterium]|nr:AraC family transcriptional regulator [Bacteroidota bacterium]
MRAILEDIQSRQVNQSFVAYEFTVPFFEFKWHYHPEYELTLIKKGKGKRIIGDSHQFFLDFDLVFIGPGLPHTWFSDSGHEDCEAVVIQFREIFIQHFIKLKEFYPVTKLLIDSKQGLFFKGNEDLYKKIMALPGQEGLTRVSELLTVLQLLAEQNGQALSSKDYTIHKNTKTFKRINLVCQHIQSHYQEKLSIEKVAGMLFLTKSAFCKFFKRAMKTPFSDYVNDIRIGHSCRMLTASDKTIKEIALECGFESLTYFNRVFQKKNGMTPSRYRALK